MSDFELDLSTRQVIPPDDMGAVGVASDERVRPLRFIVPRFYEGYDLAEFQFRVNYENAGGDDDIYIVDDMEVGEDSITLTWLLSRLATAYEGTVTFVICGLKFADDGITVEQEINSTVATFEVLQGFEVADAAEFAVRLDWLNAIVEPMVEAEALRVENEEARVLAEAERVASEEGRVEAESERESAEAARVATFADIVATMSEAKVLVLADGQYDEDGRPTIEGTPGIVYFVPIDASNDDDDGYIEWAYLDGAWERMGTTQANLKAVSAEVIDELAADGDVPEGNEVVTQSVLKLLWAKLKAAFASKVHQHSASDITSGTFGSARLANGSVTTDKVLDKAITGAKLADEVNPTSIFTTVEGSKQVSLGANASLYSQTINFNIPTGYVPVGVLKIGSSDGSCLLSMWTITYNGTQGTLTYTIKNWYSQALNPTVSFKVGLIKNL